MATGRSADAAGKALEVPDSMRALMPSSVVDIQVANSTAAFAFLLVLVTAKVEPPSMPLAGLPSQLGIGATAHLPLCSGSVPLRTPAPQAAPR